MFVARVVPSSQKMGPGNCKVKSRILHNPSNDDRRAGVLGDAWAAALVAALHNDATNTLPTLQRYRRNCNEISRLRARPILKHAHHKTYHHVSRTHKGGKDLLDTLYLQQGTAAGFADPQTTNQTGVPTGQIPGPPQHKT